MEDDFGHLKVGEGDDNLFSKNCDVLGGYIAIVKSANGNLCTDPG